jgi:hypothetical protein
MSQLSLTQQLLTLPRPQPFTGKQIILTTDPARWAGLNSSDWQVWDLSALRSWVGPEGYNKAEHLDWIYRQLLFTGWHSETLQLNVSYHIDFGKVICDLVIEPSRNKSWAIGVLPVLESNTLEYNTLEYELEHLAQEFFFQVVCITDGQQYEITQIDPEFGMMKRSLDPDLKHGLPRPEDAGLEAKHPLFTLKKIASFQAFNKLLAQLPPSSHFVIDETLFCWPHGFESPAKVSLMPSGPVLLDFLLPALKGSLAIPLPPEVWANKQLSEPRSYLLKKFHLDAWLEPFQATATNQHVCFFSIPVKPSGKTWIEKLPEQTETSQPYLISPAYWAALRREPCESGEAGVAWQAESQTPWTLSQLLPCERFFDPDFLKQGPTLALGEVCDCLLLQPPNGPFQFLPGDICLPVVSTNPAEALTLIQAERLFTPPEACFCLRLKPQRVAQYPSLDSTYLWTYFQSEALRKYLATRVSGLLEPCLAQHDLLTIPLVLLPLEPGFLKELYQLHAQLNQRVDQLFLAPRGLIGTAQSEEKLQSLYQLRATAQMMQSSAENLLKVEYQICTYYPFVLAFLYRQILSLRKPMERYKELLRLVENLTAFLACQVLALLQSQQRGEALLKSMVSTWRKQGASLGHWRKCCIEGLAMLQTEPQPDLPWVHELARLKLDKMHQGPGKALNDLISAKNDFKHDRGPIIEEQYQQAYENAFQDLNQLMGSLNFFKDYPLWEVLELNRHPLKTDFELTCLRHMGDHPALHHETLSSRHAFGKEQLLLQLAPDAFISLYPYLSVGVCPQCQHREVFFIDRITSGKAMLKSFERGHIQSSEAIATFFA